LDQPVPHPTRLSKLVGRAGPEVLGEHNATLLAKLAAGTLLRCRKLRIDTTAIEADVDHPTDAGLVEHAVRTLGGLARRIRGRGTTTPTADRNR
jgi:IS5 family transposase